jgi:glycosyltransferase involved in cell wall biosynthesis
MTELRSNGDSDMAGVVTAKNTPSVHLVFITYNRLDYTRKALASILRDPNEAFTLTIWDNASTDGTRDFLRNEVADPRIDDVVLSEKNVGQIQPLNAIWSKSRCDLLGKLDNDCLVTPGWTHILARAHADIPQLGVVACWHFMEDDFDVERAKPKIAELGGHRILRHPWTCGTGLLIKRRVFEEIGPLTGTSTSHYWLEMARRGYVNGFYYPLVLQEHMDDPRSEHSHLKDEQSYQEAKAVTYNLKHHGQDTLADRWRWRQEVIDNLTSGPWDVRYYTGWRGWLRNQLTRVRRLRQRRLAGKAHAVQSEGVES